MQKINIISLFIISVVLTFCSATNNNDENKEDNKFRKYHNNEELLTKGYVKIYVLNQTDKEESVVYNLQKMTSKDEFVSIYFDKDFVKTKEVYYQILKNGFEESKYLLYRNNTPFALKVAKPLLYPFYETENELKSEYIYPENRTFSVKSEYTFKFIEKSRIAYKKDSIECVVYQSNSKTTEFNKEKNTKREKYSNSKMYFGEGLGYVYHVIITENDTISYMLKDIIEVEDFEKMK